ncbi:anaphase-promoting complex [Ascochyta rabiei]|uniref:Anaphase-promoting complex n=1 Tax=Didymella rabiei TaxID=5454 RepID=A0A162YGZ2_DIDRA|nr:anaphase-promoting complex [Ascochyta rabiei]
MDSRYGVELVRVKKLGSFVLKLEGAGASLTNNQTNPPAHQPTYTSLFAPTAPSCREPRLCMASLRSIGVHRPAALQYLVSESILSEDCTERDYVWDTYADENPERLTDEVVTTEHHVVWSRGGIVRKVFNFAIEKEKVIQALLTWFPVEEPTGAGTQGLGRVAEHSSHEQSRAFLTQGMQPATDPSASADDASNIVETRARALVVFLRSQAHVFFLSGTTHIVNLPFEVDRAFPAARGVVVQRRIAPIVHVPSSPKLPMAPPNSFLTNTQSFLSQGLSQSFTQAHRRNNSSLATTHGTKAHQNGSALFLGDLLKSSAAPNTEGLPRLFSFTDPLSELGLVVERSSLLTKSGSDHQRPSQVVNKAEEVLYVSPHNEVLFDRSGNDKPLLLVVTANYETNVFTIWSAAYLEPKSISASRKHHTPIPLSKSRRRSSHGATSTGTGATTPAIRGSDRLRDSLGGAPRSKPPVPSFREVSQTRGRLTDQAVDDVLASQLNPDFNIDRLPKESRRVSSLLSRAELSTSFDRSAFQDLATHRTSLGGSFGASQRSRRSLGNERTSLGGYSQSRNRASTPGSIASRMSFGGADIDDTLDDTMEESTYDIMEEYNEYDDVFASPEDGAEPQPADGLRKELVMTVVDQIPATQYLKSGIFALSDPTVTKKDNERSKVLTLNAPFNSATLHERKLYLYISHSSLSAPLECEIAVTRKRLDTPPSTLRSQPSSAVVRYACWPKLVDTKQLGDAIDLAKIRDGHIERVVLLSSSKPTEPCLSLAAGWGTQLPLKMNLGPLKLFDPYAIHEHRHRGTAGLKRTITPRRPLQQLISPGRASQLEIVDADARRHRVEAILAPTDQVVRDYFRVISTILPNYAGDFLLQIWWTIRKSLSGSSSSSDWIAFVSTLFTLVVPFLDDKPRRANSRAKSHQRRSSARPSTQAKPDEAVDDEDSAWHLMCNRQNLQPQAKSWTSSSWAWALHSSPAAATMGPPSRRTSAHQTGPIAPQLKTKQNLLIDCLDNARQFCQTQLGKTANDHWRRLSPSEKQDLRISSLAEVLVSLHLHCEERKLDVLSQDPAGSRIGNLIPVLAQLGHWLRWEGWGWQKGGFYDLGGASSDDWTYDESSLSSRVRLHARPSDAPPPSILDWLSTVVGPRRYAPFPTLAMLIRKSKASPHSSINIDEIVASVTPRTMALHRFFRDIDPTSSPRKVVELIEACAISTDMIVTLPEAAKAPLMEAITRCQANPPTTWSSSLLKLVQREDLDLISASNGDVVHDVHHNPIYMAAATRDIHAICQGADRSEPVQSTAEVDRHYITRLIFREDRRFMEAHTLLEPLRQTVAEYRADSRSDEAAILEGQKIMMQWVMIRTFSLPVGSSMIKFSSKKPLLTEKYPLYGFSTSCLMKPMGNVVTAERQNYSEEKYFWAFFNAGAAAGLSISRDAQGIDTSWIMYNKPAELTNKHAGLLLGLGLNGHLRTIAKWLSFKYLTPKHTMTSVGLLLGLSASFMGTMDTLVTRLLSVHVTRMLPPGAAELNLSPYTQTTGLMGIGLLYYNTQHRRMSEVMLSEIEHVEVPDPSEPPDSLRDEAYRLSAGFALGFINLGKGRDLGGLRDMQIVQRLMTVAVAPKSVNVVHILDQATAGAVIAIALIYMKTHDRMVARKIDVPDTLPQFDYVRPDIFLLRTLAKHIIMWDDIEASDDWMINNLPVEYRENFDLKSISKLRSEQMPFYNIVAGLLWSISLKHAGTGDVQVRDFLVRYLDQFMRIAKLTSIRYDSRLARNTVRNCQDLIALSAATVMAGTGDLDVLRRLRALHGRIGPDTPYGSHLAAHMAFGALFIAGGTQTFSRSNKAVASLICAFYPLFPSDVQDSRAHLQAFRHFWVLAAEPRCLVVRDVDTGRAMSMPITIHFRDDAQASKSLVAPCLLPEVREISRIETTDVNYWPTTLDFVNNASHLHAFQKNQTLHVRRRSARDTYSTSFSATLVALNEAQSSRTSHLLFHWIFSIPAVAEFVGTSDAALVLPVDPHSKTLLDPRSTVVESRLVLGRLGKSWRVDELRELRGVFEWAEMESRKDGRLRWLGREVVERLRAGVLERGRQIGAG